MKNCSKEILSFHNDKVTLPQKYRTEMKNRRDSNRSRLKSGLTKNESPKPREIISQGSYAMKTMVQQPNKDYDIDDGVYFNKEDLVGEKGGEMSARNSRKMVRDAVDDGTFNVSPECLKNCVRVYYNEGFHIDLPVYRHYEKYGEDIYELASSEWKRSDAREVTKWFETENERQSADSENGRQLRRIVRLLKSFSKSRKSWKGSLLGGFGITKLVVDNFHSNQNREDESLYHTMVNIRDSLEYSLIVNHPLPNNEPITDGRDDPRARKLKEKLNDAIENLKPLFETDCTEEKALSCWDKVYNTDYFSKQCSESKTSSSYKSVAPGVITSKGLEKDIENVMPAVDKRGDSTFA